MQIIPEVRQIRIVFNKSDRPAGHEDVKEVTFPYSVYNRLKNPSFADTFSETNLWLDSLEQGVRHRIFRFYMNCYNHFYTLKDVKVLVPAIRREVVNIQDLIDYTRVVDWNEKAHAFPKVELEEVHLMKEEELKQTTYSDQEAYALTCMGVVMKVLTPIFGTITDAVKSTTSNRWKELKALELLDDTRISVCAPYVKLQGYCYAKADPARNKISPAAMKGVTIDVLKRGTLALALVRFLAIYNIKLPKNIILALFQDVKTYIDTSCTNNFHDKAEASSASANAEDGDGVAQHWRRPQDSTPNERGTTEAVLYNNKYMKRDLRVNASIEEVMQVEERINRNSNVMTQIHMGLMGAAFIVDKKPIISLRLLSAIDDKAAIRRGQAWAYMRLKELGYETLAEILITPYMPREHGDMSDLNTAITPFTEAELEGMAAKYPLHNQKGTPRQIAATTPAYLQCAKLVKFCTTHHLQTKHSLENLRREFAHLVINL